MAYTTNSDTDVPQGFHRMPNGLLMIGDYHLDTFNYSTGDAFLSAGEPYIGYYNVSEKTIYPGRTRTAESQALTVDDNIKGNFLKDRFFYNRGTSTNLKLSYDIESLKFQPSEFVNQNSINEKLDRLYDNFLDLYNYSFIRDNNIPSNYTAFIGCTGGTLQDNPNTLNYVTNVSSAFVGVSAIVKDAIGFEVIGMRVNEANPLNAITPDDFLTIYFTTSAISVFKINNLGDRNTATFIVSTDRADGPFSQQFQQITDISTNNRDTLYISDAFHNQIYRLYIDPILNDSRINQANFDLINAGGLKLNTAGTDYLSGANLIYYYENEIYTWNDGRKSIIVLKDNLSKVREYTAKEFSSKEVADFAVNPISSKLFILFKDFTVLEVDALFKDSAKLAYPTNVLRAGEIPKRILFSQNDSNVYYIITTKNVYKYLLFPDQDDYIGAFRWTNAFNVELTGSDFEINDAKILAENEDRDSLFLYHKDTSIAGGRDRILRFNESNELLTNLHNDNFKIYDRNDVRVDAQYFNNITFNKSIKKLLYNLDTLASRIEFRFLFGFEQSSYRLTTYLGNIGLSGSLVRDKNYDYFLGVNEVSTPQVFNRCISQVYQYQQHLLGNLLNRVTGTKYAESEFVTF